MIVSLGTGLAYDASHARGLTLCPDMYSTDNRQIIDQTHPSVMKALFMANEWVAGPTGMVTVAHIKDNTHLIRQLVHQIWYALQGWAIGRQGQPHRLQRVRVYFECA